MKKFFAPLLRSLLWGVVIGLIVVVLELLIILVYLQGPGKLAGMPLTNYSTFFLYSGAIGVGLGLTCGLFWMVLSRTSWYRRLEPEHVRAWERGLLVGLYTFIYVGVVVLRWVNPYLSRKPLYDPVNFFIILGVLFISVGFAFSFESLVIFINRNGKLKMAVSVSMATLLVFVLGTSFYLQHRLNFWNFVSETVASSRPNILLITIDTLRADHLSAYGYTKIKTENIDRLVMEGVLFEQAIAQSSWTKPSMGSIWTSLYPSQHQAIGRTLFQDGEQKEIYDQGLKDDILVIAELFSDAGYITLGLNTNPNMSKVYGFDRGFQLYIDAGYDEDPYDIVRYSVLYQILEELYPSFVHPHVVQGYAYLPAEKMYKMLNQIIVKLQVKKMPFFLWVHFMDPHIPYYSHGKEMVDGRVNKTFPSVKELLEKFDDDVSLVKEHLIEMYDAEIIYLDHYIGEVLSQLRENKLLTNTLVVLTSDHGEEFFDHERNGAVTRSYQKNFNFQMGFGHGHTMYDELIRVPLIMKFPNNKYAGRRIASIVQHIDLLPTLLAFAGISVDYSQSRFEGINLLPFLGGEQPFLTRYAKSEFNNLGPEIKQIRSKDYKLIYKTYDQTTEFYNLVPDSLELNNLVDGRGENYQQMLSALQSWMARMPKGSVTEEALFAGVKQSPSKNIDRKKREKLKERLKALGYVQ